jgi:hypothetical protein
MASDLRLTFKNFDKWQRKLKDPRLIGGPIRKALLQSAEFAVGQAKELTPVDTGRARNSYATKVDPSPVPQWASIGSNLEYMKPLEFGSKPHFPPPSALQPWASRHGFPAGSAGAFLVARVIAARGTKAHHMLRDGIKATRPFLNTQLAKAASTIEASWRSM